MQTRYTGRRQALAYILLLGGMAGGIGSFAAPPVEPPLDYEHVTFPKGTENCQSFIRGGGYNMRYACEVCCRGTVDPDKKSIPGCLSLCGRYADPTISRNGKLVLPDGSPAPALPRKPRPGAKSAPANKPNPPANANIAR